MYMPVIWASDSKGCYRVCIITGGSSEGVVKRLEGLEVKDIFWGVKDKIEVFLSYSKKCFAAAEVADSRCVRMANLAASGSLASSALNISSCSSTIG